MADTVTIEVTGLKTIQAALEELPKAMQRTILGEAIFAGADVLKQATAHRIHSRTGQTVKGLRIEVQVEGEAIAGAALIGGSMEKGARAFPLNFLERGTKPHVEPKKRKGQKIRLTLGGRTVTHRAPAPKPGVVAFGGKVYSKVQHPGFRAQAPLRIALAEAGEQAVAAFGQRAWEGIVATLERGEGKG